MEFVTIKRGRNRRKRRKHNKKKRIHREFEVKTALRRKTFCQNVSSASSYYEPRFLPAMMDAHAFWENYKVAQEWQKRHTVAWWKSRCRALQHENQALRRKLRDQVFDRGFEVPQQPKFENPRNIRVADVEEAESDENLEFQVDKEMLDFLEQSIRHKMERQQMNKSKEQQEAADEEAASGTQFVSGDARMRAKMEDARLLYGKASPGIMAMEAALQATVDRHRDRAKPYYWPNIPLKP